MAVGIFSIMLDHIRPAGEEASQVQISLPTDDDDDLPDDNDFDVKVTHVFFLLTRYEFDDNDDGYYGDHGIMMTMMIL